jgi:hypothetical protein
MQHEAGLSAGYEGAIGNVGGVFAAGVYWGRSHRAAYLVAGYQLGLVHFLIALGRPVTIGRRIIPNQNVLAGHQHLPIVAGQGSQAGEGSSSTVRDNGDDARRTSTAAASVTCPDESSGYNWSMFTSSA